MVLLLDAVRYCDIRHTIQMPTTPPTVLMTTPHSENMLACHRLGTQPPIVEPTMQPNQIAFFCMEFRPRPRVVGRKILRNRALAR